MKSVKAIKGGNYSLPLFLRVAKTNQIPRIEKEKQERRDRGDPSDDDTPRSPPKKGKKLSGWKKVIADAKNKESSKGKSKNTKTPVQKTGKTKPGKNTKAAKETRAYLANDPMLYTVDNTKCIGIDPDLNERMYPTASSRVSSKRKGVDSLSFLDDPAVEILFQARRQSNRIAARRAGSKSFVKSTLGAKGSWVFGK